MIAILLFAGLVVGLTPPALIDREYETRGYGAITRSSLPMPMLEERSGEGTTGLEIRLKNLWRVRPSKTTPGVYLALVTTSEDLVGGKYLSQATGIGTPRVEPPKPAQTWDELAVPGGKEVSIADLERLFKTPFGAVPWIYERRHVRVRVDPKRIKDPIRWIAALVDAKVTKDGKRVEFNPGSFRRLAVPTLENAAKLEELARNRMKVMLAVYAHEEMDDDQMRRLYRAPNMTEKVISGNLLTRHPDFVRSYVDDWIQGFGRDEGGRSFFLSMTDLERPPAIDIVPRGYGNLAFYNRDGDGWVVF